MDYSVALSKEDYEIFEVAWSGSVISSVDEVARHSLNIAGDYVNYITRLRMEASISGAMRWPWSSEYPIRLYPPRGD